MSLTQVDWSALPTPADDGGADHLMGLSLPSCPLASTAGGQVDLQALAGLTVVYIYPLTASPDIPLPEGWDGIPGARGCTPQSCAFRDHYAELTEAGVAHLFGLSAQNTAYQREAVDRLHLPYPILSDAEGAFADALNLPRFEVEGLTLLRRMTLILRDGDIETVFYPVFPPDRNPADVLAWLTDASD
ncbi:MAG: peroxiredoxin [Pseudomonadota bacterium]